MTSALTGKAMYRSSEPTGAQAAVAERGGHDPADKLPQVGACVFGAFQCVVYDLRRRVVG